MEKINKTKNELFENIYEIDNSIGRLSQKRENKHSWTISKNERGDPADTIQIVRNYNKPLHTDTFDNLYKMDKFLEKHHLPKLTQEGIAINILSKIWEMVIDIQGMQRCLSPKIESKKYKRNKTDKLDLINIKTFIHQKTLLGPERGCPKISHNGELMTLN